MFERKQGPLTFDQDLLTNQCQMVRLDPYTLSLLVQKPAVWCLESKKIRDCVESVHAFRFLGTYISPGPPTPQQQLKRHSDSTSKATSGQTTYRRSGWCPSKVCWHTALTDCPHLGHHLFELLPYECFKSGTSQTNRLQISFCQMRTEHCQTLTLTCRCIYTNHQRHFHRTLHFIFFSFFDRIC